MTEKTPEKDLKSPKKITRVRSKLTGYPMEKVFRTRFETANRVYRYFRTGPYNFSIWLGFDALRLRISSQGISCTNIQLLEMLNEIFTFEIFEFSTVGHRWISLGCMYGLLHRIKSTGLLFLSFGSCCVFFVIGYF